MTHFRSYLLIRMWLLMNENKPIIEVFIAKPIKDRMITLTRDGDTQSDAAERQEHLDIITDYKKTKNKINQDDLSN